MKKKVTKSSPLAVYVVHHSKYQEGCKIYEKLYQSLGSSGISSSSLNVLIPTFHIVISEESSNENISYLSKECERFEHIAIIQIVDGNMVDCKVWLKYLTDDHDKPIISILPVKASDYVELLSGKMSELQFISYNNNDILGNWTDFETRVYNFLIKSLQYDFHEAKPKIFISHSKKDIDHIGEIYAKELKEYLRAETKFDSFFDVNDIQDGDEWQMSIEEKIKDSWVIAIFSNVFSDREWCRKEIIAAKRNERPILLVSTVNGDISRVFPYIGNTPCVRYNARNDWPRIINKLFRIALRVYYSKKYIQSFIANSSEEKLLITSFLPEAMIFSWIGRNKTIVYPEPHLNVEEEELLKNINARASFYTPSAYNSRNVELGGKKIGVSVATPDKSDLLKNHLCEAILQDITIELMRYILVAHGRIIYGGDLRRGGYTERFRQLALEYGKFFKNDNESNDYFVENYVPWPDSEQLTQDEVLKFRSNFMNLKPMGSPKCTDGGNYHKSLKRAIALSEMRNAMSKDCFARILVGGKLSGYSGFMPGIMEEFACAVLKRQPIFLIGGFGGVSKVIADIIMDKSKTQPDVIKTLLTSPIGMDNLSTNDASDSRQKINLLSNEISYKSLNNGLTNEMNKCLFTSTDIIEIVSLILCGLKKCLKKDDG